MTPERLKQPSIKAEERTGLDLRVYRTKRLPQVVENDYRAIYERN